MTSSRAKKTPDAPSPGAQRASPVEADPPTSPEDVTGRAADESLPERYAQLRASGLACSRW